MVPSLKVGDACVHQLGPQLVQIRNDGFEGAFDLITRTKKIPCDSDDCDRACMSFSSQTVEETSDFLNSR